MELPVRYCIGTLERKLPIPVRLRYYMYVVHVYVPGIACCRYHVWYFVLLLLGTILLLRSTDGGTSCEWHSEQRNRCMQHLSSSKNSTVDDSRILSPSCVRWVGSIGGVIFFFLNDVKLLLQINKFETSPQSLRRKNSQFCAQFSHISLICFSHTDTCTPSTGFSVFENQIISQK